MGTRRRACVWAGLLLLPSACLALTGHAPGSPASASASVRSRIGTASVPAAARGPISAAVGSELRAYRVHRVRNGRWLAVSAGQALTASFGSAGARVSSGGSLLALRLAGVGYDGSLARVAMVEPSARGNRVTYRYPDVTEWYANGPLGIEQGFTISRPLPDRGAGQLRLSIQISGNLRRVLAAGGRQLDLERSGRVLLAYRDLTATDASGRSLAARLELSGGRLSILVDDRGASYPLRIDPLVQQAELTPADGAAGDDFGSAVAVSADGSTVAVGSSGDASDTGAVYVFTEPVSGWAGVGAPAKLTADGGAAGDHLGASVAISSDGATIVAGAPGVSLNTGAVYVFNRSGAAWATGQDTAELTNSSGSPGDKLGFSVAVSGDGLTVVTGAPFSDSDFGTGYVFTGPSSGPWGSETSPAATLMATDKVNDPDPGNDLGWSSAISADGSTIVLGASGETVIGDVGGQGSAYVYVGSGSTWAQKAKLTASDGGDYDMLGTSVATSSDGSTVVAGAPSTANPGAVYVFTEPAMGGWINATQTAKLTAADGAAANGLGDSVAISADGSTVVAGAYSAGKQGAAYVFGEPAITGWADAFETQKLTASDGAANDQFGFSVAASSDGSTLVAGATNAESGKGAAYPFAQGSSAGPFPLTVAVSPSGTGTVTSQPAGIACPTSCATTFAAGTSVTLSATPAGGQRFAGWSGDCAGTATPACTLTMSQARTATALFTAKTPTKLTVACSYSNTALAEICTASVTGGATTPTGQVVFQSSNGGGFASGNGCTLAAGGSCAVGVLPPDADLTQAGTVDLSATYNGDASHASSIATALFSTAPEITALQASVGKSCSVFVVNPTEGGLTSIGPTLGGTFVASMTVVAADAFGLIPPAPGSSSAADVQNAEAGDNGTEDTTCVIQSSPAAAADVSAGPARATLKTVVIARVKRTLKSGRRYTIRVPLNAAGRHFVKLLKAADKTYLEHHHGKQLKPPRLKIRVTLTFRPSA